jgi:type 1 glutamine amidotransferase
MAGSGHRRWPRAFLLMGQASERQFHNQPEHWEVLAGILRAADLDARVISDDLADLNPATLARFDVLLNFSTDLTPTEPQLDALLDAVRGGIGYVGLHAATATFRASDEHCRLVGSRFERHPPIKRFTVEIVDRAHPVTAGVADFEVEDERYELKELDSALRVLARAEGHPSVYVKSYGAGRVCYLAPGHDRRSLAHPAYAQLVRQAITWAARPVPGREDGPR